MSAVSFGRQKYVYTQQIFKINYFGNHNRSGGPARTHGISTKINICLLFALFIPHRI